MPGPSLSGLPGISLGSANDSGHRDDELDSQGTGEMVGKGQHRWAGCVRERPLRCAGRRLTDNIQASSRPRSQVRNTTDVRALSSLDFQNSKYSEEPGAQTLPRKNISNLSFPTPWAQMEAGMAIMSGIPLLIVHQTGVEGGVFGLGENENTVHRICMDEDFDSLKSANAFSNWSADVREQNRLIRTSLAG